MDITSISRRFDLLESKIDLLSKKQEEFNRKALIKLSLSSKNIYTKPEAADFLGVSEAYIDQLTFRRRLEYIKGEGQKFKYFKKKYLEEYILGSNINKQDDSDEFEDEILKKFKKK
jgi:hypothetical protein